MSIAAILFVELLDVIQIEMNLLIAAIVRVLPLVVWPVIREVNRSYIVLQRVLFRVEAIFLVSIFVRVWLEEALARASIVRRRHALIHCLIGAEFHVWLRLSHSHRVLYTLMKWVVFRCLAKFSLVHLHFLSGLLVYRPTDLAFLIIVILLLLILLLNSIILLSFSLQIYTLVIFAVWKRYFILLKGQLRTLLQIVYLRAQLTHVLTLIAVWAFLLARLKQIASLKQIVIRPTLASAINLVDLWELHITRILAHVSLHVLHLIVSLS